MQMMLPQMEPKKKPRLTSDERKRIEKMLDDGWTPYKIAKALGRPPKTVMREIVNRAIKSLKGSVGRINNRCVHRFDCQKRNDACKACLHANRSMFCRFCRQCNSYCYKLTENGQSVHAAVVNNPDVIPVSEKTVYRYIDGGLLKTKNGDLPRKCKLAPRKGKGVEHKVDAQCRIGRSMEDYHKFIETNPGLPVTEMDTVEGTQEGVDLMMSHVNSYLRPSLADKAPYDVFAQKFGTDVADLFNIRRVPANDIVLKPKLLGIEQKVRPWVTGETSQDAASKKTS